MASRIFLTRSAGCDQPDVQVTRLGRPVLFLGVPAQSLPELAQERVSRL